MSHRHGWSSGQERAQLSPFTSNLGRDGVPHVTDQDYEYITSEDLQSQGVNSQNAYQYDPRASNYHFQPSTSDTGLEIPDDDIILIKNNRVTYPEHFPAYSIGDGKLLAGDVRDRVQLVLKLSDKRTRRVRLLYKGKQLKDDNEPVCIYGVKNNSEILVTVPEEDPSDDSGSSEEIVVVGKEDEGQAAPKPKKKSKSKKKKKDGNRSPDSGLEVPPPRGRDDRRGGPSGAARLDSPGSGVSGASAAGGPVDKLNSINSHFTTKLLPMCVQFTTRPPADLKKREDEHRKISETIMQQVLLKLDEVETMGEEEARAKRKELVRQVQEVLQGLDKVLKS